jgi:hypothetical protein
MTTMPQRLNAELEKRIFVMLDGLPHNYKLVLNVPHVFKRGNEPYPPIPSGLQHHPRIAI